jgi:hypothetical protein
MEEQIMKAEDERKVIPDYGADPVNDPPDDEGGATEPASGTPESHRPKLVHDADAIDPSLTPEEADEEAEYRAMRRDLPGTKGASAAGIVAISVGKIPGKNEFFRTHKTFSPVVSLVVTDVGMDKCWLTATAEMEKALAGIEIKMLPYVLYLTVTDSGTVKIIPIRCPDEDMGPNLYNSTKEHGLIRGRNEWVRLYTDIKNGSYKVYPAPKGRFSEPVWPELKHAKIFRLAFRDKGHCIDSCQHPLFMKWAGRRADDKK